MKNYSNTEMSNFCESLAMLINSGIPEEEALSQMAETENDILAQDIKDNYDYSFFKAVEESGKFPNYMVDMIKLGEATGRLGTVLVKLANYFEKEDDNERKIAETIIYPSIIMFIVSAVLLYIALMILPVFKNVYEMLGGVISNGTFGMLTGASVIAWVLFALCFITAVASAVLFRKWKNTRDKEDAIGIFRKFGFARDIILEIELAKFTAAVSNYYSSGIDIETAMSSSLKLVKYDVLKERIERCISKSEEGEDILQALNRENIYTKSNTRILLESASLGKLNEGFESVSGKQWIIANQSLENMTDSIEPAMALALSVIVALLLISIMLPLISIMTSIA